MSATKILWGQILIVFLIVFSTTWGATEYVAWKLGFQAQLGPPWFVLFGWLCVEACQARARFDVISFIEVHPHYTARLTEGQLNFPNVDIAIQGLLISSVTRNQFLAAQIALFSGFLPAFMLSGFLYEIDAMPAPIRAITWLIPARYFVSSLKTIFLAGDIWAVFVPNLLAMAGIGILFFLLAKRATRKNLE